MDEKKMMGRIEEFYEKYKVFGYGKVGTIMFVMLDFFAFLVFSYVILHDKLGKGITFLVICSIFHVMRNSINKIKYLDFNKQDKRKRNIYKYLPIDRRVFEKFYLKKELKYNLYAFIWRWALPTGIYLIDNYRNINITLIAIIGVGVIVLPMLYAYLRIKMFWKS